MAEDASHPSSSHRDPSPEELYPSTDLLADLHATSCGLKAWEVQPPPRAWKSAEEPVEATAIQLSVASGAGTLTTYQQPRRHLSPNCGYCIDIT